ncbi:hypothetical protein SAMN05444172_2590 [Burkholderia sp. GAS332]|nr:hypothetical protein SAMN05444172_2590 [Burkholderia sp. GAS332]
MTALNTTGVTVEAAMPAPPPGARFQAVKEEQRTSPITDLAAHVQEAWETNRNHRVDSGIEEVMNQCTRQRNGEYDADDKAKLDGIEVYINITGLKCRAAESWIKDVLVNAADQPWTIASTPIPELPDYLKVQVADLMKREIMARGYMVSEGELRQRAKQLKETARKEVQRLADEACDRMTEKINDQMTEAGWKGVFEQWQSDLVTYPGGVMKAPVMRNRRSLKWDGNTLLPVTEAAIAIERVSPLDLYPSPEATNPQDANSIIERMRMTKAKLYECIGLPNYDDEAIRMVISEFEEGYRDWLSSDGERVRAEKKDGELWGTSETIDVLDYWGRVQGSLLQEWGVDVDDPEAQYECNVWLVADYAIRALLNPDPLGRRPYRVTSFSKRPGQFWGEGIPQLVRDVQRSANSAIRALLRNMSYASGPIVELDVERLDESEDKPERIEPWRIYWTKSGNAPGGGGSALRFTPVPSIAGDLMNIFSRFMAMSDDLSGVPAYTYGAQTGALKTMGGFSMQYGNALKGIKNVICNMDRDGIEPTITQVWTFNMLYDPDPSIKADAKVVAKGAEGILQKEQAQARSIETLQVIAPFIQNGMVPREGGMYLLQQWLRENGFDLSDFFPDNTVNQEIAGAFGVNGAQPQPSLQPGTPAPKLDGRQAAAQQAMSESQLPSPV